MATGSIYNSTIITINGRELDIPREYFDISLKATFDQNPQANISIEELTLIGSAKAEVERWIAGGLTGGVGIFEGIPISISVGNINGRQEIFSGIIDLQEGVTIDDEAGELSVVLKQDNGLNNLSDLIEGLNYGFLLDKGAITNADYVDVDYVVVPTNQFGEVATILITAYLLDKQLEDTILSIAELAAEIAGIAASGLTGGIGAAILAAAKAIAQAIYAAAILALLLSLAQDFIEVLVQPERTHKGIKLKTLLEKACEEIGFRLNTSISELENLVYLPSNTNIDQAEGEISIQQVGVIQQGIPSARDYGYTFTELFELCRNLFNGRFLVEKDVVQFHTENADFWRRRARYIKPDNLTQPFRYNTNQFFSSITVAFSTDLKDDYTIDEFKGTNYQCLISAPATLIRKNQTLKNADITNLPVCLGTRKEELNGFEVVLAGLAGVFDAVADTFGGRSNFQERVEGKVGVLKVSSNEHSLPKLLWFDGDRIPQDHRDKFSAKTLYEKYHSEKSFVANNFSKQRVFIEQERIPFGYEDFQKLANNSYFSSVTGQELKAEEFEWNLQNDFAVISYYRQHTYTKNLIETKIEPK